MLSSPINTYPTYSPGKINDPCRIAGETAEKSTSRRLAFQNLLSHLNYISSPIHKKKNIQTLHTSIFTPKKHPLSNNQLRIKVSLVKNKNRLLFLAFSQKLLPIQSLPFSEFRLVEFNLRERFKY